MTLFVIKVVKLRVQVKKNSDHAGEQKRRSHWGVGFLLSDQFYSVFVSTNLASRF